MQSKQEAAKGIKTMVESMESYLENYHGYKNIVDPTTLKHLTTALGNIKEQADAALTVYYVYGISTPLNSVYGKGELYLYGGPYHAPDSAKFAAETAITSHGSFDKFGARWTFFVSDKEFDTTL